MFLLNDESAARKRDNAVKEHKMQQLDVVWETNGASVARFFELNPPGASSGIPAFR